MEFKFVESDRHKIAPTCPCGKSNKDGKFAPLILAGQAAPEFGHCYSCGKSFFPNQRQPDNRPDPFLAPLPPKELRFIDPALVQRTLQGYDQNNFALWLRDRYPTIWDYLLAYFSVGTTKDGGTLFWYQDQQGRFRKPKRMYYKPDGHRVKVTENEYKGKPNPLHFTNEKGYEYCLFGEFQLDGYEPSARVVLVESEKSAIIGHAHFPDLIWMATGGAVSLKREKAAVLRGRSVLVIPDMHQTGREGAGRTQEILQAAGCQIQIIELDATRENGDDIADILLKNGA